MAKNKRYNGFIGMDFDSPGALDVEIIKLFARYIVDAEIHVAGIPEDLVNQLDTVPGISIDVKGIDGNKKSGS